MQWSYEPNQIIWVWMEWLQSWEEMIPNYNWMTLYHTTINIFIYGEKYIHIISSLNDWADERITSNSSNRSTNNRSPDAVDDDVADVAVLDSVFLVSKLLNNAIMASYNQ